MPKLFPPTRDEPALRKGRGGRIALTVLLASLMVPAYESARICQARWRAMTGPIRTVETPVIDAMTAGVRGVIGPARSSIGRAFRDVPWNPALAIPFACAWALIAILFMRRC